MEVIAIANQKGGSGKSTTAAALVQAAARRGKKALLIDLDPQGTASFFTGADANGPGAFDLIENGQPAADLIQHMQAGYDVIPAALELQTVTKGKGSARRLQAALAPIRAQYDLIMIDTSPAPGELRYNALMAATQLIIPLEADSGGLQGLYQLNDEARQVQRTNHDLNMCGYIITRYSGRSTLAKTMRERIRGAANALKIPELGTVRQAVAIQEAQSFQTSLYEHAPASNPAADYMKILYTITRAIEK